MYMRESNSSVTSFLFSLLVLLGCNAPQSQSTTLFGDEAVTELGADLPVLATAFVQTGNELHYFTDVQYHENLIGGASVKSRGENEPVLMNQLQFNPKELSFGEQPIGVPNQQTVLLRNPTASTVRFDAMSGSTVHFHCSFPEDKTVNPGESTTFDVVFLPRQEGLIENVLFVHSSLGTFTYTVRGRGMANPYRVRPFVGAKVPLNGTFVSPINVHNPHSTTIRVTEMYTSGTDLHLVLPDTYPDTQHHGSLWEIPPYQTKTVMNAKVIAAKERNTTAYIRIKTGLRRRTPREKHENKSGIDEFYEETLVVPVEVEVTKKRGIFATVDLLDFGLIRSGEKSATLTLEVVSTLEKGIDIESLYVERSDEPNGIYMEFASKPPISVKCGARQQPGAPKAIAKLNFDSKLLRIRDKAQKLIRYKGRIVAESRGGNYNISVPYIATVYSGTLSQSADDTAFHSELTPPISHSVSLTNDLPFGIAVWNVSLGTNAKSAFVAKLLTRVVSLSPGESKPVFWLKYNVKQEDGFISHCTLHTNVTTFSIPIVIFNGRLRVTLYSIDQSYFDFGLMDTGESRSIYFAITNENPVPVTIKQLRNALPSMTKLTLLGVELGNQTVLAGSSKKDWSHVWQQGMDFVLQGRNFAVFKYTITTPNDRTVLRDTFVIETDFEKMTFPVKYSLEKGTVVSVPERMFFSRSFPGKMSSQSLQVYSTFKRDMQILRMSTLSSDPRIFFESFSVDNPPIIKSNQLSNLGRVLFMPSATCVDDCYVGMPLHTADGQWFTYGVGLPQNLAEIDSYLYKRMRRKWLAIRSEGKHLVNVTVMIDTQEVKHVPVPVQGELVWPRLLTRSVVHFPLTAVGNFTIVNLTLRNPSSKPVVVQLLPLVIYPDAESLVDFFRDELDSPLTDPIEMNETLMFSLRDTELFTLKPDSPVPKLREQLEEVLGIQIPKFTLSMLLQPGMKVRIRVGFLPSDYTLRSSLLLIRNNLTVMEPVVLYGRGARMDMQVEGRAARTRDPLLFEILPHHLSDCHNPKRLMHKLVTTLTVKRSFTVVNTGEVAFTVVNISLNNIPCENRGFKVLNCHPFRLAPNESHVIDIAYTPDFLMSWNEAALQFYMHMNGSSWLFPLGASVPMEMLAKCHAALPRPPFESLMYYSCVSALIFCLICVVACAYLEGDRTIACAIRQQYTQTRRVFDLNALDANGIGKEAVNGILNNADTTPPSPRRHVLHYAEDSNILMKFFWQTANGVLWLFSFVWQFRSDEPNIPPKNAKARQAKAPVVKNSRGYSPPVVKGTTIATNKQTYISTEQPMFPIKRNVGTKVTVIGGNISESPLIVSQIITNSDSKNSRMNGDYRVTKTKITASNSVPTQTKSPAPSPTATNKTFTMPKTDLSSLSNSFPKSKDTSTETDWRRDSETASDASWAASSPATSFPTMEERLKKKEAIMDSETGERIRRNREKGVSRSGDELSTSASNRRNQKHYLGKRILSKSNSSQRESNENGGSASSDLDSDLMVVDNKQNTVDDSTASLNISETNTVGSGKEQDWLQSPFERSLDERSEAGFSDTSAAPEWVDGPAINNSDDNVDDDFTALSAATEHLFDKNEEIHQPVYQPVAPAPVPPVNATSRPNQQQQPKRNSRKKQNSYNSKASNASSRSASCSSLDTVPPAKETTSSQKGKRRQQGGTYAGVIGTRKADDKPDGRRPSAFIQQLQKERRMAEDQFRKRNKTKEEPREVWPGFNLKLPALAENLWDADLDNGDSTGGMWRPHSRSSQWPPTPTPKTPSSVTESVRAFRLNPEAPPFISTAAMSQQNQRNDTAAAASSSNADLSPGSGLLDGLMDDPLGLSGSLFGRGPANIWAAGASTGGGSIQENGDSNSAAVYWAEKFLAEEEKDDS